MKLIESVSIAQSPVLDVVPTPRGELLATTADGTIALLSSDLRAPRIVRAAEEMSPPRVIHVSEAVVALWGWESVTALSLEDGSDAWRVWELDGHHGLDGDEGACTVFESAAVLPDGTLLDVARGALLEVEGKCFVGTPCAAGPSGIVFTEGRTLRRWRPGAAVEQLATLDADVRALAVDPVSAAPTAVLTSRHIATPTEGISRAIPLPLAERFGASVAVEGSLVVAGFAFETVPARWFHGLAVLDGERVLHAEHARSERPFIPLVARAANGILAGVGSEVLLAARAGVERVAVGGPVCSLAAWGDRIVAGTTSGAVVVLAP